MPIAAAAVVAPSPARNDLRFIVSPPFDAPAPSPGRERSRYAACEWEAYGKRRRDGSHFACAGGPLRRRATLRANCCTATCAPGDAWQAEGRQACGPVRCTHRSARLLLCFNANGRSDRCRRRSPARQERPRESELAFVILLSSTCRP